MYTATPVVFAVVVIGREREGMVGGVNRGVLIPPRRQANRDKCGDDDHSDGSSNPRIQQAVVAAGARTTTATAAATASSRYHPRKSYGTSSATAAGAAAGNTSHESSGGDARFVEGSRHDDDCCDVPTTARNKLWRRRRQEQHLARAEESGGVLRRSLASLGVLVVFCFALNMANDGRLKQAEEGLQSVAAATADDAPPATFVRVSVTSEYLTAVQRAVLDFMSMFFQCGTRSIHKYFSYSYRAFFFFF